MSGRLRVIVGAVGLAGHTLPALALAGELHRRGHEVRFHGFERWRTTVEELGIGFAGGERAIAPLAARDGSSDASPTEVVQALLPSLDEFGPDVVVGDALTLSPALAAEVRGIPAATLLPEVYPVAGPGLPLFSIGLVAPRTALGAAAWRMLGPPLATRLPSTRWLRRSRRALDEERRKLGLPPAVGLHASVGAGLTMVATLPELEYPRDWPAGVEVTGAMIFDPPHPEVDLPAGEAPLVVVAPSTVKDPEGRLVRATLAALADEPVRVVVTTSGTRRPAAPVPANAAVVDWIDYSGVIPRAALVVCHGNHGTVVKALSEGVPVLISPAMPDDAEHGARVAWAGAGLMVPRPLLGERSLRAAARRLLGDPSFAERAAGIAAAGRERDGAARGADLVEAHAGSVR